MQLPQVPELPGVVHSITEDPGNREFLGAAAAARSVCSRGQRSKGQR